MMTSLKYINIICPHCDNHFNITACHIGLVLRHNLCGNNCIIIKCGEYKVIKLNVCKRLQNHIYHKIDPVVL